MAGQVECHVGVQDEMTNVENLAPTARRVLVGVGQADRHELLEKRVQIRSTLKDCRIEIEALFARQASHGDE